MRIRDLRYSKGLRQEDVAHALGWTPATLSRIENGKQNTKLSALEALAKFYEVSVPELFEYDGDNPLIKAAWAIPDDQAELAAEMLEVFVRRVGRH